LWSYKEFLLASFERYDMQTPGHLTSTKGTQNVSALPPEIEQPSTQPTMASPLDQLRLSSMCISPNGSLFTNLNFDVRTVIYKHMDLPPIGNSKDFKGFILSCRQAYLEAEETAPKIVEIQLQRLKIRVEAETGVPVELPDVPRNSGFAELRDISIAIPYAALGISENKDKVHVQALRIKGTLLLFLKNHFNKVSVTFHGDDQTTGFASQRERGNFMWHLGILGWGLVERS
jgi:hypothetical protein